MIETPTSSARRIGQRFAQLWFAPHKPYDLAAARLLFFGHALAKEWQQIFWWDPLPPGIAEFPGVMAWCPVLPAGQLQVLLWVVRVAVCLSFVGLWYRPAALCASLGLMYFIGLESSFGKVMHSANLFVMGLLVLAVSNADDALSVKAWLMKRKGRQVESSGEYRWPIRAIWLSIAGMYCAAGVSKLVHTGWSWALSGSFRNLLLVHHYTRIPPTEWGLSLAQYPLLCQVFALGALILELLCPLLLLGGWFTFVFGGGLMALQLGIFLMLGVKFEPLVPVFLTLVPWTWLAERLRLLPAHVVEPSPLRAKVLRLVRFASISGFLLGFKFGWMWLLEGHVNPQFSYAGVQAVILFLSYGLHATFSFNAKFSWRSFRHYVRVVVLLSLTDYLIFSVVFSLLNITALPSVAAATLGVWLLRYSVVSRVFRNASDTPAPS